MGGDRMAEPEMLRPTGLHPRGTREPPVVASERLSFPIRVEAHPQAPELGQPDSKPQARSSGRLR